MKPLLRWTIGEVHACGYRTLRDSVKRLRDLYDFDFVICHNNQNPAQLEFLKSLGVELIDQIGYQSLEKYTFMKLSPSRLRPEGHEIFLDNDVVLYKKIPEIDQFIESDATLVYEGLYGLHGAYSLPKGIHVNSGIFGLPPGYEFETWLKHNWLDLPAPSKFDEQGLVGKCLLDHSAYIILPQCRVPILESHFDYKAHRKNQSACGFHFVGANREENLNFMKFMGEKFV